MNQVIDIDTKKHEETEGMLEAERRVNHLWDYIKDKIVPDVLYKCFTEDGIAQTCSEILKDEAFYKPITDSMYIRVHTQYYKEDTANIVFNAIRWIGRKLNKIKSLFSGDGEEALGKSLKKTGTHSGLKSIFSLMKTEACLIRTDEEIDPKGLIMSPEGPKDPYTGYEKIIFGAVFTKCTNYIPAVGHIPVKFFNFLYSLFEIKDHKTEEENKQSTHSVIDRLLNIFAIALTGQAPQIEKFLIFSGKGGTGKQQLLELMEKVVGSYFLWMRPESLYETTSAAGDTPRSDLRRIMNVLYVGISEPSDAKLSASLFKTLASGETIPCRLHHSRIVIDVKLSALFIILSNRKPYIQHDSGVDRRLEVYEFNNIFYDSEERISDIGQKIAEEEGPQILGELIRRAGEWKERGGDLQHITKSETVEKWTELYIGWSDVIGRFLEDETEKEPGEQSSVSETHKRFCRWADENNENRMSGRAFGEALSERGIHKIKKETGWKFTGIKLIRRSEYLDFE